MQKLIFELSPRQLKYKNILDKEFLELEVYAISDINPNRNDTHFTLEAMKKALPTFKNKPIVGLFEKGDFTDHAGRMLKDPELNQVYWDTEYGERILGFIRESDAVEIVEKDGLHWIRFTCVLCVRYCYKQVRRLLKDKTKKVSVEIHVLKSEVDEEGIEHILDFTLDGTTILGSKQGRPVLEGIPGAHLSVLEQLDDDVIEEQRKALCFAYAELNDNDKSKKEEDTVIQDETYENETVESVPVVETEAAEDATMSVDNEPKTDNPEVEESAPETYEEDGDKGEDKDGEDKGDSEDDKDEDDSEENKTEEFASVENESTEECQHEEEAHCEKCAAFELELSDAKASCETLSAELEEYKSRCDSYSEEISHLKAEQEKYADYEAIKEELASAKEKLFSIHCESMKNEAVELMADEQILDEDRREIEMKCTEGKYSCKDEIVKDIAYASYKARSADKASAHTRQSYSVNINTEAIPTQKSMTREERIANYAAGNKK